MNLSHDNLHNGAYYKHFLSFFKELSAGRGGVFPQIKGKFPFKISFFCWQSDNYFVFYGNPPISKIITFSFIRNEQGEHNTKLLAYNFRASSMGLKSWTRLINMNWYGNRSLFLFFSNEKVSKKKLSCKFPGNLIYRDPFQPDKCTTSFFLLA
jgi:hypothetical protein